MHGRLGAGTAARRTGRAAALVAVALSAGCAAHRTPSLADRFIVQAPDEPAVETAASPLALADPAGGLQAGREAAGLAAAAAERPPVPSPPTVEGQDPRLGAAIGALSEAPTPEAHLTVAGEYRRLGVYDTAHRQVSLALSLDPGHAGAYAERARVWRDWGQPKLALGDATRAVYFAPGSVDAHNTLGTVLFALGQLEGAEASFVRAMAIDPDAGYVRSNLCYVAFTRGLVDAAAARCAEALDRTPDLEAALNNRALVSALDGRLDEARHDFLAAGGPAASHYNMGMVLLMTGDYALAAAEFDAALKEDPDSAAAFERAQSARRLAAAGGKGGR